MGFTNLTTKKRRRSRLMAHVANGWPHYRANTLRCICLDNCCYDSEDGCICKHCLCSVKGYEQCHDISMHPTRIGKGGTHTVKSVKAGTPTDMVSSQTANKTAPIKSPVKP